MFKYSVLRCSDDVMPKNCLWSRMRTALLLCVFLLLATGTTYGLTPPTSWSLSDYVVEIDDCVSQQSGGKYYPEDYVDGTPLADRTCDSWESDIVERPFSQGQSDYYPNVDIERALLGLDDDFFYVAIDVVGTNPVSDLEDYFYYEIDLDGDFRGDYFVQVKSPKDLGSPGVWSQKDVEVYFDENNNVGCDDPLVPDGPCQDEDGYEKEIWKVGGSPSDGAWARVRSDDPTVVEMALSFTLIPNLTQVRFRGWVDKGVQNRDKLYYHDAYIFNDYGSPYPELNPEPQNVYEIDQTGGGVGNWQILYPYILVDKVTDPAGDPTQFNFELSGTGLDPTIDFSLTDGSEPFVSPELTSGTYAVTEEPVSGWENISATCDNGDDPGTVNLDYGEIVTCTFINETKPLIAVISSFSAVFEEGQTVVQWQTAVESGTLGFHLERLDEKNGTYVRVNRKLLPGFLVSPQGGTYRYVDPEAEPGTLLTYRLVEKEARGPHRIYGPYTVMVDERSSAPDGTDDEFKAVEMDGERLERLTARPSPRAPGAGVRMLSLAARPATTQANPAATGASPKGLNILITKPGMYRLTASDLAASLGRSEQKIRRWIRKGKISLTNRGLPVAWYSDNNFRRLNFYGEGIDSQYTWENVYQLGLGSGRKVKKITGRSPKPVVMTSGFIHAMHVEQDVSPTPGFFDDPEADYWIWKYMFAHVNGSREQTFALDVRDPVPDSPAVLRVMLQGGSDADHRVIVKVNGNDVGTAVFRGMVPYSLEFEVEGELFTEGQNTVTLTAVEPTSGYSVVCVQGFDLRYERQYTAANDRLFFSGGNHPVVTVGGFGSKPLVFDVTDPAAIKRVKSVKTRREKDGGYHVSLKPGHPQTRFLAISDAAIEDLGPTDWVPDYASALRATTHEVDYLVIAPQVLAETARRLADYRRSQGLKTMVALLEDIHDEFNYGIAHPEAVHDLLSYAWHNWAAAPRYVVRCGEGTYDYRDIKGHGENLILPKLVSTPYGIYASENRLADVDGSNDGVPEMAMGLLPADSPEQLEAMIDKIMAYEASAGEWTRQVMLVADNPDRGGDFHHSSDQVARWVSDEYTAEPVYMETTNFSQSRSALLDGLNAGALIFNYVGHAGWDRLAGEGLMKNTDVADLGNAGRLPVFLGMTCSANRFELPGFDAIGEMLVTQPNVGAVAAWSPTGWSLNHLAQRLGEAFFLAALEEYGYTAREEDRFMLHIYTLIGDPATRLR